MRHAMRANGGNKTTMRNMAQRADHAYLKLASIGMIKS